MTHIVHENGDVELPGWKRVNEEGMFMNHFTTPSSSQRTTEVVICIQRLEPDEPWFAWLVDFGLIPMQGTGYLVQDEAEHYHLNGFDAWLKDAINELHYGTE